MGHRKGMAEDPACLILYMWKHERNLGELQATVLFLRTVSPKISVLVF